MNHSVESYREGIIAEIKDHFGRPGNPSHVYSLLKELLECQPRHFDERLNEIRGKLPNFMVFSFLVMIRSSS